jgi:hypothetical protein
MNTKSMHIVFAALLALPVSAIAQTSGSPYPTTPSVVGKVIVESTYYFARRDYQPPVPVPTVSTTASFDTPEASTIASISAMKRKDFDAFRSMWDESSRRLMEAKDRELGQTRETWIATWERLFANGARTELVSRVDSGEYVIVAYRIADPDPAVKPFEMQAVLKAQGKRWFLTQEMSADPVFSAWRRPEEKVQRVGRQLGTDDVAQ